MSKQEFLSYRSFISLVRQFYIFICKTSHKKFDFFTLSFKTVSTGSQLRKRHYSRTDEKKKEWLTAQLGLM